MAIPDMHISLFFDIILCTIVKVFLHTISILHWKTVDPGHGFNKSRTQTIDCLVTLKSMPVLQRVAERAVICFVQSILLWLF